MTREGQNYKLLQEIAPEIITGESNYIRFQAGEGFMPLSIEEIGENRISVAHTYIQNGDVMADPDMEFIIDRKNYTLSAHTYQQDGLCVYDTVENDDGEVIKPAKQAEWNEFSNMWFSNIKEQGYQKEKMYVSVLDYTVEVTFDSKGKVKRLKGDDEATAEYAKKNGLSLPKEKPQIRKPSDPER